MRLLVLALVPAARANLGIALDGRGTGGVILGLEPRISALLLILASAS